MFLQRKQYWQRSPEVMLNVPYEIGNGEKIVQYNARLKDSLQIEQIV